MARNPTLINFNRVPADAVGSAYQAGLTNINEFAPNQDMADALLKRGSSTEPVQSVREGIYRALTGGVGGFIKGRDKRNLQTQKDDYTSLLTKALMAGTPTEGTVGKAERIVTPIDNRVSSPDIANPIEGLTPAEFAGASLNSRMPLVPDSPAPASVDPSLLQTEIGIEPPPPAPTSILDDPSVPDVASLGLERIETPTGPGGQIIEQPYVPGTPGTPGGLSEVLKVLDAAGTPEARAAALQFRYGALADQAQQRRDAEEFAKDLLLKRAGPPSGGPTPSSQMKNAKELTRLRGELDDANESGDEQAIKDATQRLDDLRFATRGDAEAVAERRAATLSPAQDIKGLESWGVFELKKAPFEAMKETAQLLLGSEGLDAITGISNKFFPTVLSASGRDADALRRTLISQIKQNVLQSYRSMSETGGAVGQVSDAEQRMFAENIAALENAQSKEQAVKALDRIISFSDGSVRRLNESLVREFGPQENFTADQFKLGKRIPGSNQGASQVIRFDSAGNPI